MHKQLFSRHQILRFQAMELKLDNYYTIAKTHFQALPFCMILQLHRIGQYFYKMRLHLIHCLLFLDKRVQPNAFNQKLAVKPNSG